MTEPFFFDGDEEEDDEPEGSALAHLSLGIAAAVVLFAALCVVALVVYVGVTMIDFGQWINWGERG